MNWELYGSDRKERFEKSLEPDNLRYDLMEYQDAFGKEFSVRELLDLYRIKSNALIAEAINDVPEFLLDQIGKMRNSGEVSTITNAINNLANAVNDINDYKED